MKQIVATILAIAIFFPAAPAQALIQPVVPMTRKTSRIRSALARLPFLTGHNRRSTMPAIVGTDCFSPTHPSGEPWMSPENDASRVQINQLSGGAKIGIGIGASLLTWFLAHLIPPD